MTTPLLRVSGLCIAAGAGTTSRPVVHDVGFQLQRGRTLAIVGGSGSGKSLTCLALPGLLPRTARVTGGQAWFDGRDLLSLPGPDLRALRGDRIGFVFQDPLAALHPCLPVGVQVAEPLRVHRRLAARAARAAALAALEEVGIENVAYRSRQYPHEFSGGQRQRIVIAMALVTQPDLLIADEPTSALDVTVQGQILGLLAALQRRHRMAMLLVSHDLAVVAGSADEVLVLHDGRCVESGPARALLTSPRDAYTRALVAAVPAVRTGKPAAAHDASPPLLHVEGLCVRHANSRGRTTTPPPAVQDLSLDIFPGEILGLVGETGSGKSTLARAMLRLLRTDAGRMQLGNLAWSDLTNVALRQARPRVQMIFQDPYLSLNPRRTVFQCLAEALQARAALPRETIPARVGQLLADVGLAPDAAARYPHAFSGGQRQRIAIARALAPEPDLLVADEPVSALDVAVQGQILALLLDLTRQRRLSMLFITHDLRIVRAIADRVAVMYGGRLVELADVATLFTAPAHPYTRSLLAAIPAPPGIAPNFETPAAMRE